MHPNPILDTIRPVLPNGLCIIVGSPFLRHRLRVSTPFQPVRTCPTVRNRAYFARTIPFRQDRNIMTHNPTREEEWTILTDQRRERSRSGCRRHPGRVPHYRQPGTVRQPDMRDYSLRPLSAGLMVRQSCDGCLSSFRGHGSEGHCRNLMDTDFTEIGAGYAIGPFGGDPAGRYWTFDLADR